MSGIFGVLESPDATPCERRIGEAVERLAHRGAGARAVHVGPGIGLANVPHSVAAGHTVEDQPVWDATGRYALVYDGRIYNMSDIAGDLESAGTVVRGACDAAVILRALIQGSPAEVLPRFNGMFALALYDAHRGTVLLARDRFGMKPLYYSARNGALVFASEVAALRPWIRLNADRFSVAAYLAGFPGPTKGFTLYEDVQALAPGTFLRARAGAAPESQTFFSLADFWDRDELTTLARISARETVDRLEAHLLTAIERQCASGAGLGALCSGGVDSSILVAMAARLNARLPVFHANIVGSWSEVDAARALARHVKLDLQVVDVQERDFVVRLPEAMRHYGHPYTDLPNCVPFMMVTQMARDAGMTGLLSGEGSDTMFLGMPWVWRQPLVRAYHRAAARFRHVVRAIPRIGPIAWPWDESRSERLADLFSRNEFGEDDRSVREGVDRLSPLRPSARQIESMRDLSWTRGVLDRNDRLGMASGVEARYPFLDSDLARSGINMPARVKLRWSPFVFEKAHPFVRDKWVVREVARRWMPSRLSQRIKIGFWTTVFRRMRVDGAYFDNSAVGDLVGLSSRALREIAQKGGQDLEMRLLHLDVWLRVCVREEPVDASAARVTAHVTIRPE